MRNLMAEKIIKKMIENNMCEYGIPEESTFVSTHALRKECNNGAFSWYMYSGDRQTIFGSSETATEIGKKNNVEIYLVTNIEGMSNEELFAWYKIRATRTKIKYLVEIRKKLV